MEDLKSLTGYEIVSPSGFCPRSCLNYPEPSLSGQDLGSRGSRGQRPMGRNPDSKQGLPAGTSQWQGLATPWGRALGRMKLQIGELRPVAPKVPRGRARTGVSWAPPGHPCFPGEETRRQDGITAPGTQTQELREKKLPQVWGQTSPHQALCSPVPWRSWPSKRALSVAALASVLKIHY